MVKNITGASIVTDYQLRKFSQNNNVDNEEIISLYIKYALEFNIQVDVAYIMCLTYTNFLKNEIVGNNVAGIGVQSTGKKLETFDTIEDCIIAHYEILQKASTQNVLDNPHSTTYRRIKSECCSDSNDVYQLFKYDTITGFSIYEYSRFIRELNRTRKEKIGWASDNDIYYFVKVRSSKSKQDLIKIRSDLINKKFDKKSLFITNNDDGSYTLEAGRYTNPINTNILLRNLQMFGYNGVVSFRIMDKD